jgi:tetratricopeptide (TPR) repeat protein
VSGPTIATIKRLFAVSGDRCAFPGCTLPLVVGEVVTGEVCHIKAQSPDGPRYDPDQSDTERHGFDNLVLMCGDHHKVIDADAETYTVEELRRIKAKHEARYAGGPQATDEIARQFLAQVGDVGSGAAVAVGPGARAIRIGNIRIDARLWPVVVLLLTIIGVLAYFLLRSTSPKKMTSEFNVAIAEFATMDPRGSSVRSRDGRALADFLYERLQTDFSELDLPISYELWPPAYVGRIAGSTREERAQAAEALAKRIGAHVIVYGIITQAGARSEFAPEFYVNYRGFEGGEDITGEHEMGSALRVVLPFDAAEFQGVENPALTARVSAFSLIVIGLSYYAGDDYVHALEYFRQAEATEGWLQNAGKEVVYLLLGNASARLASKSAGYLEMAMDYYDTALSINPAYARAQIGRAGVLYLIALGDPANPSPDTARLDEAEDAFAVASTFADAPESANIPAKRHFGLGQIYLVRALVMGEDWQDRAHTEFEQVVQEYQSGNERIVDLAGHAYARLAWIAKRQDDPEAAIDNYQHAIGLVTPYYQAYYYTCLGEVYVSAGQRAQAIEAYEEAISIAEFYGDETSADTYTARLNELRAGY